jgi:FkbM family methyltransferase
MLFRYTKTIEWIHMETQIVKRFSQNLEQDYILEYFNDRGGTFLDLGANDGITFSNTRALALTGLFKGVLVEPSPKAYERLKQLYDGHKGIYTYPFAITNKNGNKALEESGALCSAADVGLVSTFHQHEKARFQRTVKYESIEVKTFKWKTFLNRLRIKEFDMVSIDVEGDEMNILPDMDLSKTKLICIEWNSKPELKKEYDYYLKEFKVIYTSGENLIYVR